MKPWTTIIIGIILIIAGLGLFFGYRPLTTTSCEEVCDDWDGFKGTFDSWDEGDVINIFDEIYDIQYVPNHLLTGEPIDWTYITFKSADMKINELGMIYYNPSKIWGFMVFKGDLTDTFKEGDRVEVKATVKEVRLGGSTGEVLDWCEEMINVFIGADDPEDVSYGNIDVGNKNDISHASIIPEVVFGMVFFVGVIFLIYGASKLHRMKKEQSYGYGKGYYASLLHDGSIGYTQQRYDYSMRTPQQNIPQPKYQQSQPPLQGPQIQQTPIQSISGQPLPPPPPSKQILNEGKDNPREAFRCPECGNVMYFTVPYTPFECYCDKCGIRGVIK